MAIPTDISNLKLWLKADAESFNDGDAVGTWTDRSGSGVHMTQVTAGSKPTFKTNIIGTNPVLRFDGGDFLSNASVIITSDNTLFAVSKWTAGANGNIVGADGGSPRLWQWRYESSTVMDFVHFKAAGGTSTDVQNVTSTIFNVLTGRRDSTTIDNFVNGISGGSTATTAGSASTVPLFIGSRNGIDSFMTGDIAEVIMYNSALNSTDRQSIEAYLTAKYFGGNVVQARLNGGMQQLSGGVYN